MTVAVNRDQVLELVTQVLVDEIGVEPELIREDATLVSMDVDSLDLVEVAQVVEEKWGFRIRAENTKGVDTLGDAVDMIVKLGQSGALDGLTQPLGAPAAAGVSATPVEAATVAAPATAANNAQA
jgi:acyl carrier protein